MSALWLLAENQWGPRIIYKLKGVPDEFVELSQVFQSTVLMFVLKDDPRTQESCVKALISLLSPTYTLWCIEDPHCSDLFVAM